MTFRSLLFTGGVLLTTMVYSQNINSGYTESTTSGALTDDNEITYSAAPGTPIESILSHPAVQKKQLSRHTLQAVGYRSEKQLHFIAHIRKEQLHGRWQSFYRNSQICDSGNLKMSIPDGEWKTWYPDGQLKTIRTYSADKYHFIKADVRLNHPKYPRYRITHYAQQRKKITHYFQPLYESNPALIHAALLEKIGHNTEGDGSSYLPPFAHSLHHGLYINYYADGRIKDSGYYANGLKHGIWVESGNEETVHSVGFYDHGRPTGQWKYYNNGQLLYMNLYKRNGTLDSRHSFE